MRGVQLTGFGGPERLVYRDDVPDPQAGPGEVRIRVAATAINNTDVWTRQGAYGTTDDADASTGWRREPLRFPRIQGSDVVGRIDQVGNGVTEERLQERVVVDPMLYTGDETALAATDYLGSERDGGFAELVTVPAANAHAVESALSNVELATFPTAYATAWRMLNRAAVGPSDTVLVTGASGGVGAALLQLAAVRGATTVAVAGARKHRRLRDLGASATVDRRADDLRAAIAEATAGTPPDVVADVVGGSAYAVLLDALRPLGRYVIAGAMAGPLVETDLRTVYLKQLQLVGSSFGTHEEFADVLRFAVDGRLEPLVAGTYPLSQLAAAQAEFARKDFVGKLVVVPDEKVAR